MNPALAMSADNIGFSFANDPELRLPQQPRFVPEVLVIPYGATGLLFEGAFGTQVLNGRAARGFIPRLLPLLDGSRSLADLRLTFPSMPENSLRDTIALLYSRGLLEDGLAATPPELEDVAAFAGRYVDVTRVNRNRGEVLARLAAARIGLLADGAGSDVLAAALGNQGLAAVRRLDSPLQLGDIDLLVAMFVGEDAGAAAWLEAARRSGRRALHAQLGAEAVEIGPLFVPGKSACYDCLRALRRAPRGSITPADLGFWAGVLALQAFLLLSRLGRPNLYNVCHVHRRTPQGAAYEEVRLARLPGCAVCGLAGCAPGVHERNGQVWLLHNAANGMPPHDLLSPRDYQMHYAPANLRITRELPEPYYGATPQPLPPGAPLDVPPAWLRTSDVAERAPCIDTLATLLRMSVGYQPMDAGGLRRVAPSGGGLGSAELFVIARGITGLPNGVYHYYAQAHRLDRLRETASGPLAGALGISARELPPLILVGVGALGKLRQKYGNFAFRFASLDAGFARVHLYDVMGALGLAHTDYPDARDRVLAAALGVPLVGGRNLISYAVGVGAPRRRADLSMVDAHQYVDALIDLAAARDPGRPNPPSAPVAAAARLPAPAIEHLDQILLQRRSVRRYAPRPLPAPLLRRVATLAVDADYRLRRSGALALHLRLWAAVTVGDDALAPGVYGWDAARGDWTQRRAGPCAKTLDRCMLQRSLARAPAVLFITGDFEHAVLDHGARGYRELIGRSGAMVARALLAATAYGISGCPWGGLTEDGWGELLSIDRYRDCPLFGVSLGYPANGDGHEV